MSRGFIKEGDQEEIPMVPPRAHLPKGMPNYVTHEGLESLKKELEDLENERVEASGNYILSNFIDAKIKLLSDRINISVEVDQTKADKETVSFGAYVKYNGRTVRIVGVDEADFSKGRLSFISPVAKALIGRRNGEKFEIKIPKGTETIEIQGIWYEAVPLTGMILESEENAIQKQDPIRKQEGKSRKIDSVKNEVPDKDEMTTELQSESVGSTAEERSGEISDSRDNDIFIPENNIMEFLPVVNERGIIVGRALNMELHNGNKILHPSVHLHVIDNKGEVVRKYWWHLSFGDTPEKTLKRKLSETLGISGVKPKLKKQYIRETKTEKELVYVYNILSEKYLLKTPERKEYFDIFAKD